MRLRLGAVVMATVAAVTLVVLGLATSGPGAKSSIGNPSVGATRRPVPVAQTVPPRASGAASARGRAGPGRGWRLNFSSDFAGSRLNPRVWDTCYPWAKKSSGCTNFSNKNTSGTCLARSNFTRESCT